MMSTINIKINDSICNSDGLKELKEKLKELKEKLEELTK